MPTPAIALHSAGVKRAGGWLLQDLSVNFQTGILAVVGASGAGKTTLLSLLAGLEPLSAGSGNVLGHNLSVPAEVKLLQRELGLVMQQPRQSLPPLRKVLEIVAEPLVVHEKLKSAEARSKAAQTLESMGLNSSQWNRTSSWLSGGECQRVSIARCLVRPVRLILADEPTASLDMETSRTVLQLLTEAVARSGCSMVYVTHRRSEAATLACHILELADGRLHPYRAHDSDAGPTPQAGP